MARNGMPELEKTFVAEHQTLMRGLTRVLQKLQAGDFSAARKLADELDRTAGPHIQFEEQVLYPEVGRARGKSYEQQLRDEHKTVQRAIKRLINSDLSDEELSSLRTELEGALNVAVEHAESCGTLISHLETFSAAERQQALQRHDEFRERAARWTELSDQ